MYQVNDEMLLKFYKLEMLFKELENVVVAYSGGVDSTFLMKVGTDILKNNCIGILVKSELIPKREINEAIAIAKNFNFNLKVIETDLLNNEKIIKNPLDRCYFCKIEIFKNIKEIAIKNNINYILEGSNADDLSDYRPGLKALKEIGIKSPLLEFKFTKYEIRALSKMLDLPTWNKESLTCLATRIMYEEEITEEKLKAIERIEEYLINNGFKNIRARHIHKTLKIETSIEDFPKIVNEPFRSNIVNLAKDAGYIQITLDLEGYKQGKLKEII